MFQPVMREAAVDACKNPAADAAAVADRALPIDTQRHTLQLVNTVVKISTAGSTDKQGPVRKKNIEAHGVQKKMISAARRISSCPCATQEQEFGEVGAVLMVINSAATTQPPWGRRQT